MIKNIFVDFISKVIALIIVISVFIITMHFLNVDFFTLKEWGLIAIIILILSYIFQGIRLLLRGNIKNL